MDNSLNWKEHIKTVSTKVSRAIGFLKHAKTFLGQETLKTLYTGIVEHTLDIVALFGVAPVRLSFISCKNFKTELLEL